MKVTKQEYLDYINNYINPLTTEVCQISGTPLKSHIDSITEKTIATVEMEWMSDEGEVMDDDSLHKYYIDA